MTAPWKTRLGRTDQPHRNMPLRVIGLETDHKGRGWLVGTDLATGTSARCRLREDRNSDGRGRPTIEEYWAGKRFGRVRVQIAAEMVVLFDKCRPDNQPSLSDPLVPNATAWSAHWVSLLSDDPEERILQRVTRIAQHDRRVVCDMIHAALPIAPAADGRADGALHEAVIDAFRQPYDDGPGNPVVIARTGDDRCLTASLFAPRSRTKMRRTPEDAADALRVATNGWDQATGLWRGSRLYVGAEAAANERAVAKQHWIMPQTSRPGASPIAGWLPAIVVLRQRTDAGPTEAIFVRAAFPSGKPIPRPTPE